MGNSYKPFTPIIFVQGQANSFEKLLPQNALIVLKIELSLLNETKCVFIQRETT